MQFNLSLSSDADHGRALDETGFWGRQGAGLFVLCPRTGGVLLPLRSSEVEQPHTWGTWGGAIDSHETPRDAAAREFREEAGIRVDPKKLRPLYVYTKGSFKYTTYLALLEHELTPRLTRETERAAWYDWGDFPAPLHFGLKAILSDAAACALIEKIIGEH